MADITVPNPTAAIAPEALPTIEGLRAGDGRTVAEIATPAPTPIADPALDATAQLIAGLRASNAALRSERDDALRDLGDTENTLEKLEEAYDSLKEHSRVADTLLMERIEVPAPKRKEVCTLMQRLGLAMERAESDAELAAYLNEGWEKFDCALNTSPDEPTLRIVTLVREVPAEPVQPQRSTSATIVGIEPVVTFQTSTVPDNTPRVADQIIFDSKRLETLPVDEIDPNADDYTARVIRSRLPAVQKMELLTKHTMRRVAARRPTHAPFTPSAIPAVR